MLFTKYITFLVFCFASLSFAHDADPSSTLAKYVMYGEHGISFDGNSQTATGGLIGTGAGSSISTGYDTDFNTEIRTQGSLTLGGSNDFTDTAKVNENLSSGGWFTTDFTKGVFYGGTKTGNISGAFFTQQSNTVSAVSITPVAPPTINDNSNNCSYNSGWTCSGSSIGISGDTLLPGNYGVITISDAGALLKVGEYHFASMVTNEASNTPGTLTMVKKVSEVARILVDGSIQLGSSTKILTSEANDFGRLLVYSTGSFTMNSGTQVDASIYTPYGKITVVANSSVNGQMLADTIHVNNNFNGTSGVFVPFDPSGISLVGAASFALDENSDTPTNTNFTNNTRMVKIPVELDAGMDTTGVSVDYIVRSGTATSGSDFAAGTGSLTGTLNFAKNSTTSSDSIWFQIIDDAIAEGNEISAAEEYIQLVLHNPQVAVLLDDAAAANVYKTGAVIDSIVYHISLVSDDPNNVAPTDIQLSNQSIDENNATKTFIGVLTTTDANLPSDSHTYTFDSGVDDASFQISNDSLFSNAVFDAEVKSSYSIKVKSTDNSSATFSKVFTITINNLNDNSPVVPNYNATLDEDSVVTSFVVDVNATDADNNTLSYNIISGNTNSDFSINSTSGVITIAKSLDYERTTSYTLLVEVSDGINKDTSTVTITIVNLNDNAPATLNYSATLAEDSVVTSFVVDVDATDADNNTLNYSIISGNTNSDFGINSTSGVITIAKSLDYERTTSYTLLVEVTDGVNKDTSTVTITIVNLNDNAPIVSNYNATLAEDSVVTSFVVDVNATDADNNTLSYSIISGNTDSDFSINSTSGIVTIAKSLDYERTTSYALLVEVFDGFFKDTATVQITITNVNEAPVSVVDSYSVNEDEVLQVSVANGVLKNDTDIENNPLTSVLVKTTVNGTLVLNVDGSFTYTPKKDFFGTDQFSYQAKDSDLGNVVIVSIIVNPINDAPIASNFVGEVTENNVVGVVVGSISAADVDQDVIQFSLVSPSNTISVSSTGVVSVTRVLDYEAEKQHTASVYVVSKTDTITITVTVNVINVKEVAVATITKAQIDKKVWVNPTLILTNQKTMDVTWLAESKTLDSTWSYSNPENTFIVEACNPSKDDCGKDSLLVRYSEKQPELTVVTKDKKTIPDGTIITNNPNDPILINVVFVDSNLQEATKTISLFPKDSEKDPFVEIIGKETLVEGINEFDVIYTDPFGNKKTITVKVTLDTKAPKVIIVTPTHGDTIRKAFADVVWTVDGENQDSLLLESLREGKNWIVRSFTDLAGNKGYDSVMVKLIFEPNSIVVSMVDNLIKGEDSKISVDEFYEKKGRIPEEKEQFSILLQNQKTGKKQEVLYSSEESGTPNVIDSPQDVEDGFEHLGFTLKADITFPSGEVADGQSFGDCIAGDQIWNHQIVGMRVDIYDMIGQFVDGFSVPLIEVSSDYMSKDGKAQVYVEKPVDALGKMAAQNGTETATGVYLMSVAITVASNPSDCNTLSKGKQTTQTLLEKVGYKRK